MRIKTYMVMDTCQRRERDADDREQLKVYNNCNMELEAALQVEEGVASEWIELELEA